MTTRQHAPRFIQTLARLSSVWLLALLASAAHAAEWSDTYLGYRYGSRFAEPYGATNIHKNIFTLAYADAYRYGSNFFNADVLLSNASDPAGPGSDKGAEEIYVVYRHTLDLGKLTGKSFAAGPIRGVGLTAGFDWNRKHDAGYNSQKEMLVAGPTLMLDVPGFLNVSLLQLWESNAPCNRYSNTCLPRYHYDPHPMLNLVWGIPLGGSPWAFEGYANFIADKGRDEYGAQTRSETNIDMQLMYDASRHLGMAPRRVRVGVEYQYWINKFGYDRHGPAGPGAVAKTPMLRAELHF